MTKKKSGILKKILKILGLTLGIVLILLVALVYSLRFPKVQQYITQKAIAFYHSKVDANASIGRLYVDFPSNITIEKLYLEDTKGDTLVNIDYLTIQTDLWALLDNELHLSDIELQGLKANIKRPDSTYNFQFIVDGFATQQESDSTGASFEFSIGDVNLSKLNVLYDDRYSGITTDGYIGELVVGFQTFDLNRQALNISSVKLSNADASLRIYDGSAPASKQASVSEAQNNFTLDGNRVTLDNVKFNLEETSSNIRINHQVGYLDLIVDKLDINKNIYLAKEIKLKDAYVFVNQFAKSNRADTVNAASENAIDLLAGTENISVENSSFKYYSHSDSVHKGFDPLHLWVQKFNTSMSNTFFENGDLRGEVHRLSAFEKSGLRLNELQGDWQFSSKQANVAGLILSVNNSKLDGDINLFYPDLATIAEDPSKLKVDVNLQDAQIDTDDLIAFVPSLDSIFQVIKPHHIFNFSAKVKGSVDQLAIESLNFQGLDSTWLAASGSINGLPDAVNATYDFSKIELFTKAKDLNHLIGDSLQIQVPQQIHSKLSFSGRLDDFTSKGNIKTTSGDMAFGLNLKMQPDSVYQYTGDIDINQLDVGNILSNDQLGKVTLNGLVDGKGFSLQNLDTKLTGFIEEFDYNNYAYKSIDINGRIQDKRFDGVVAMSDENLDFDFNGLVNLRDSVPKYNFNLDLKRANLQALNFTNEAFKVRAKINSDLAAKSIEKLNGSLLVDGLTIAKNEAVYQLDTLSLKASSNESLTEINFNSTVLDASFNGNFELNTLPSVLKQHFQRYLSDSSSLKDLPAQDFVFNVDFKNPGFFTNVLVPGLNEFVPGKIEGEYNSEEWLIDVNMDFEKVDYKGTVIDSLGLQLVSDRETLNFIAAIDRLFIASSEFNNVRLLGSIDGDRIKTDFKILNEESEDRYHIGGVFSQADDHLVFEFVPGEFILNYDPWTVHPENRLEIYDHNIWVENVSISRNGEQLTANSTIENKTDTILVTRFDQFDLSFLGKFKETENYVLGGVLNGNVDYFVGKGSVKAGLNINQFSYKGDTLGNINLLAQNVENRTTIDLGIKSNRRNDIDVKGTVTQTANTELDLNAKINSLDITTIQAYAANEVSELDGNLTGQFKVTGTVDDPDIKGSLKLDDVAFRVNYLGTKYFIDDEAIDFTRSGLSFNNFKVDDEDNNTLRLDGSINSEDYASYDFKLKLKASNFKVLNTDEKVNQLVFGKLAINADADITGDLNNPKVRLDLGIANGSDVTYVIPEEEISVAERRGVVEFFDQDIENDPFFGESNEQNEDTLDVWIKGIDLRANIDVNSTSTFNVVIDPITQDKLTVSGDADLTLGMRPTGDMTLTGRYEVSDGSYDLNFYSLVKRKFDIRPGSYLLWTGDPLNARMDVSAIYTVRAAPVNTDFRRKIPFDVFLDLKGELLSPDISFRLALAEQGSAPISVQSWLSGINQQEAVLNRQVFSLLLFKTFMTSDFSSGGDNNLAQSTARNSASRILSNQLNRLGNKIKGLELSFDLQSYQDYSEGGGTEGRTELELGLSKQFFDERVVVKVAGNFDLEGGESQQKSVSDFAGDIKIEYKLTEDGRYRLVGFRQNEYDNLLQGEIAKTGVGIIFVRDYNTLKELFKKSEEVSDEE